MPWRGLMSFCRKHLRLFLQILWNGFTPTVGVELGNVAYNCHPKTSRGHGKQISDLGRDKCQGSTPRFCLNQTKAKTNTAQSLGWLGAGPRPAAYRLFTAAPALLISFYF